MAMINHGIVRRSDREVFASVLETIGNCPHIKANRIFGAVRGIVKLTRAPESVTRDQSEPAAGAAWRTGT